MNRAFEEIQRSPVSSCSRCQAQNRLMSASQTDPAISETVEEELDDLPEMSTQRGLFWLTIGLLVLLRVVLKRTAGLGGTSRPAGVLEVLARYPVARGQSLVLINLTGKTIFKRWTKKYKQQIYDSRILTTRNLVEAMPARREQVLVSTSATGIACQFCFWPGRDGSVASGVAGRPVTISPPYLWSWLWFCIFGVFGYTEYPHLPGLCLSDSL